ncbi:MAG: hypothetical protein H7X99_01395 [Saprospiraceae bacterium]|nr:hypothetical protein [Saprospiraceae bacterium]
MRILGEFDKGNIKITVFKMNERVSVKFEENLLEQTYKFRDGSLINTLTDVQRFCSDSTIDKINRIFTDMAKARSYAIEAMVEGEEESFDEII